jgi:nucleoside phosphorylase
MSRDHLLIVTAVRAETRAVLATLSAATRRPRGGLPGWEGRSGGRTVSLLQAGIGPRKARAALAAVDERPVLVVSVGFAGALVGAAAPGDVVLPAVIAWDDGAGMQRYGVPSEEWRAAEAALSHAPGLRLLAGEIFSSPEVVATPAAKRALAARTGTIAVEMESAGLIEVARERGLGFLARTGEAGRATVGVACRARNCPPPSTRERGPQERRRCRVAGPSVEIVTRRLACLLVEPLI